MYSNLDSGAIYCKTQTPDFSITWQRGGSVTRLEGVSRTQGFGVKSFPSSPGVRETGGVDFVCILFLTAPWKRQLVIFSRRMPVRAKTAYVSTASVHKAQRSPFFTRRRNSTERDSRSTVRPKEGFQRCFQPGQDCRCKCVCAEGRNFGGEYILWPIFLRNKIQCPSVTLCITGTVNHTTKLQPKYVYKSYFDKILNTTNA